MCCQRYARSAVLGIEEMRAQMPIEQQHDDARGQRGDRHEYLNRSP